MALESEIFEQDPFSLSCQDFVSNGSWSYQYGYQENDNNFFNLLHNNDSNLGQQGVLHRIPTIDYSPPSSFDKDKEITNSSSVRNFFAPANLLHNNDSNSGQQGVHHIPTLDYSPPSSFDKDKEITNLSSVRNFFAPAETSIAVEQRRKQRPRRTKNKEELENQRMNHIAVERNRRKQTNHYLAVLRSMMPSSYVQKGDQASVVGGAINFVKELEQLLQILKAQRQNKQETQSDHTNLSSGIFSDFFTFPQYTTCSAAQRNDNKETQTTLGGSQNKSGAIADVEVTMVGSYANIKVLMKKNIHKQLLKMVHGLQYLRLVGLHLNVTTLENMVLYCFTVKVEDDSQLTSANEIAASVYEMIGRIQKGAEVPIS